MWVRALCQFYLTLFLSGDEFSSLFWRPPLVSHPSGLSSWTLYQAWLANSFSAVLSGCADDQREGSLRLEVRRSFQDSNHLEFHFIKGVCSSVRPLSWPYPSSSCKLTLGKIKITFINFSLSNNLENVTKALSVARALPLISLIDLLVSCKFLIIFP